MNKIYELTFTGTEQTLVPTCNKFLPDDACFMGYAKNNSPYYYSKNKKQHYIVMTRN